MEQNINMVINCGWADEVKRFYCLTHLTYLSHVKSCMRNLCRPANRNLSSVLLKVQNLLLVTWDFNGIFSKKTGDSGEPKRLLFIKRLAWLLDTSDAIWHIFKKAYACCADLLKQRLQQKIRKLDSRSTSYYLHSVNDHAVAVCLFVLSFVMGWGIPYMYRYVFSRQKSPNCKTLEKRRENCEIFYGNRETWRFDPKPWTATYDIKSLNSTSKMEKDVKDIYSGAITVSIRFESAGVDRK